jgi:hypothetical protein
MQTPDPAIIGAGLDRSVSATGTHSWQRFAVLVLTLGVVAVACGSGCANVQPWQRGKLADYTMQPDRDPLGQGQMEHIWFSREQASGGRGVGGGGCGCN